MSDLDTNINYPISVSGTGSNNLNPFYLDQILSSLDNKKVKDLPVHILKQKFKKVYNVKPPSSRSDSSEKFVVALGFRG